MSIHRTIQHDGQTYIVLSVDMHSDDNVVIAAPITGGRVSTKNGAVVSVAYDGLAQVRVTNPTIQHGLTGAQLRNAVMVAASKLTRAATQLGVVDPVLRTLVERALSGDYIPEHERAGILEARRASR